MSTERVGAGWTEEHARRRRSEHATSGARTFRGARTAGRGDAG
ncbi:hypothetical protein ACN3XK_00165 [Actinomadura welshii]